MNSAYFEARFRASPPPGGFPKRFAIITAYNPDGVVATPDDQNQIAHQRLKTQIEAAGWLYFPVTGGSIDFTHEERGFGIVIDEPQAVDLARQYRQEAIFYIVDETIHLISCKNSSRAVLGRWQDRLDPNPPLS